MDVREIVLAAAASSRHILASLQAYGKNTYRTEIPVHFWPGGTRCFFSCLITVAFVYELLLRYLLPYAVQMLPDNALVRVLNVLGTVGTVFVKMFLHPLVLLTVPLALVLRRKLTTFMLQRPDGVGKQNEGLFEAVFVPPVMLIALAAFVFAIISVTAPISGQVSGAPLLAHLVLGAVRTTFFFGTIGFILFHFLVFSTGIGQAMSNYFRGYFKLKTAVLVVALSLLVGSNFVPVFADADTDHVGFLAFTPPFPGSIALYFFEILIYLIGFGMVWESSRSKFLAAIEPAVTHIPLPVIPPPIPNLE